MMKRWFTPNIDRKGRIVRGGIGLALLAGAVVCFNASLLGVVFQAAGSFEAGVE